MPENVEQVQSTIVNLQGSLCEMIEEAVRLLWGVSLVCEAQGSLLERLVGAAYAAHIRAREAEKAAAAATEEPKAAAEEPAKTEPLMN